MEDEELPPQARLWQAVSAAAYDEESLSPAALTPVRNPNLISRVARAIFRSSPDFGPQPADKNTTQSGIVAQALQSVYDQYFRSQNDRLAIYKDVDEMDHASEEASSALDAIANNVCTSEDGQEQSFDILCEDKQVKKIIDKTVATVGLHGKIRPWTRNTLKYGDSFSELIINDNLELVDVRQLPPSTMWRNVDARGNLLVGAPQYDKKTGQCTNKMRETAYEQRAEDTQTIVATFWPFQICHLRHQWDGFKPYGRSQLRVSRIIWKKLKAMEEAMIIARLTRAWPQNRYFVDTTGRAPAQKKEDLTAFQQSVAVRRRLDGARENPPWVGSDIFIADSYIRSGNEMKPSLTKIDTYDPKLTGLSEIADYEYLHRKFLATLRIPAAYLNFEKDTRTRAVLTNEDVQFIRFVRDVQSLMSAGVHQVIDTALVLNGIDPEQVEYEVIWPRLSATDEAAAAESEFARSKADSFYYEIGAIDKLWIQKSRFGLGDDEIYEMAKRAPTDMPVPPKAPGAADTQEPTPPKPEARPPQPNSAPEPRATTVEPPVKQEISTNGNGHSDKKVLSLPLLRAEADALAEVTAGKALGFLRTDIVRVRESQEAALKVMHAINQAALAPVVSDDGRPIQITFNEGAIGVNYTPPNIDLKPQVDVYPQIHVPPTPPPPPYPEQKAPVVNVQAPNVTVTPQITVQPTPVVVTPKVEPAIEVQPQSKGFTVERDKEGFIKRIVPNRQ